jgi:threonine synthase
MQLACTECGEPYPPTATFGCTVCSGPLGVEYDDPLDPDAIAAGGTLFEKYGARLPSRGSVAGVEGDTPLVRADRLADELGIEATVHVKDERRNPTGSFKDRALAPAVSLAAESGERAVLTASSGNAAAACAHYAARAGLPCYLLVEATAPADKLVEPLAYGARTVRVEGLFEGGEAELASLLRALADRLDAYPTFAYRPFNPVVEAGVKTVSYEVAEALDWTAPNVVVTATGGGDNLAAQHRGHRELREAGLVAETPRMVAAQAAGASPVVDAVETGADAPVPQDATDTVASGIDAPFAGRHAVVAIRESGGTAVGVTDDALLDGEAALARTAGIWAEPASAVVVPALAELAETGVVGPDDTVVLTVTGSGHKHVAPFRERLPALATVERSPDAVAEAFDG